MADIPTQIAEAEDALHRLMTGSRVVEITNPNGARVTFSETNVSGLQAYIADLKRSATPRRPIYVNFGR